MARIWVGVLTCGAVAFVGCLLSAGSFAQSGATALTPLQSYIHDHDTSSDPTAAEYVALRCAAFYTAGAAAMESEKDPNIAPIKKGALVRATALMETAIAIDVSRTGRSKKESYSAMSAAALSVGRDYSALMKADKTKNGNFGKDPLITGDSDICRALSSGSPN